MNLTTLLLLVIGVKEIAGGELTVGVLITLLSISGQVSSATSQAMQAFRFLDQFSQDSRAMLSTLNEPEFERSGASCENFHELRIDELDEAGACLHRFHLQTPLSLKKGEEIAILGPTGGGKSTLLEVIGGLDRASREKVRIDELSLAQLSSASHLKLIRYSPQKNMLLSGALAEAVFFCESLTDDDEAATLRRLRYSDEVLAPGRELSERSTNLSGGEARRLALARLLVQPGLINLVDEPTAGLNQAVGAIVWNEILRATADTTLVCVTHDYDVLARFDRVLIVSGGEIKVDSTPAVAMRSPEFSVLVRTASGAFSA